MDLEPSAPFEGWAPQWRLPGDVLLWVTPQGPGLITQTKRSHASFEMVVAYQDLLDRFAAEGTYRKIPDYVMLHDWRSVTSVDPRALEVWTKRDTSNPQRGRPRATYVCLGASSILRSVVRAISITVSRFAGSGLAEMIDDPTSVVAKEGLGPPPPGFVPELARLRAL